MSRPTPHTLPEFASVEAERLHRKQRLAATFRLFGRFGVNEGVAGHVTARDPEHPELFWVNPFGQVAPATYASVGGHLAGWFSFQPLYDKIVADQPDLLD